MAVPRSRNTRSRGDWQTPGQHSLAKALGFGVWGLGFRVQGVGFRI